MLKKMILPLIAVAVVVAVLPAPTASACARCKFTIDTEFCVFNTVIGQVDCDDSTGVCQPFGGPCHGALTNTPLSTEYEVASVERIDESPAPDQTRVARAETPRTDAPSAPATTR